MKNIKKYVEENKDRFLSELIDLLKIPSISADSNYKDSMIKTAEAVKKNLLEAGCNSAEICETPGHPVVYGEKIIDKNLPTVLVYGHYDVQPAGNSNKWLTPAFEPTMRDDGRLYARGVVDDKSGIVLHLAAIKAFFETAGQLPVNIKCIVDLWKEGNRENRVIDMFSNLFLGRRTCEIMDLVPS